MASLDVIALDTATPQLRAPAVGDTYHFCRVAEFQDGTAAAPGITNVGDTNTGIYFPDADTLGVSANGVESFRVGAASVIVNNDAGNIDFQVKGDADVNLVFVDASTDRVGLGTSTPAFKLDVAGTVKGSAIYLTDMTAGSGALYYSVGESRLTLANYNAGGVIVFETNGGTYAGAIDASQRWGIGTTTPTEKLDIASGNLIFSGTAQRVLADFGGDWATRLIFQNKTTNGETRVTAIPNGTSQIASFSLSNSSTPTNSVTASLRADSTAVSVSANSEGSATPLPLEFRTTSVAGSPGNTRMAISPDGNVGVGGAAGAATKLNILGTLPTSGTVSFGVGVTGTIPSGSTSGGYGFSTGLNTEAASFTLGELRHFSASQATIGAGSTVTNQFGFIAGSNLTGATNNYGFYGDIASGSNRYNVYMAGTADNYFAGNTGIGGVSQRSPATRLTVVNSSATGSSAGVEIRSWGDAFNLLQTGASSSLVDNAAIIWNSWAASPIVFGTAGGSGGTFNERMRIDSEGRVGVGGTADAASRFEVLGTAPSSGGLSRGIRINQTIPSTTTTSAVGFVSSASTQAASFTVASILHFNANGATIGSGSTVTDQHGFIAQPSLTGATNNYGFYSSIASGSNRWNFYAAGSADNYFAGNVGIADTGLTNVRLRVKGASTASSDYTIYGENSAATPLLYVQNDGKLSTGTAANSPYNLTTASAANVFVDSSGFLYRSTSSLRYKSDITNATHGLADVLKLRSVTYKGNDGGDTVFGGLIAEEVHDAGLTEFVAYDSEGRPDALHYGNMVALLVKAVQELTARVAELEAK